MKRVPVMKNAPKIDFSAPANHVVEQTGQPAAPAVANLSDRVRAMTGNHITLPVCGRDVSFKLETVPADAVEKATMVWIGNERDQQLLTQESLADLIPSFMTSGQQNPAFARRVSGIIEVADGSRRRQTAIYTHSEYRVLVGELDDEQMAWLSTVGNNYRETSAYERGKRYARLLKNDFGDNVSKLAESENISRKIITRCIKTAELPREIIRLFSNPNELSARSGEALAKTFSEYGEALLVAADDIIARKKNGEQLETKDILDILHKSAEKPVSAPARERVWGKGMKAKYKGDSVSFQLTGVPARIIHEIEKLLMEHQEEQQQSVSELIDDSLAELDKVVSIVRASAEFISYDITTNELQTMIPFARTVMGKTKDETERLKTIGEEIKNRYVI